MTASVNIKRGDLHLAVSTAFNRGRYVLMTGGGGAPLEITLDLKERDDDLLGAEWTASPDQAERLSRMHFAGEREDIGKWRPFSTDPHEVRSRPERHHPDVEPAIYEAMRQVKGERRRAALVWQALGLYAHETGAPAGVDVLGHFSDRMERVSESAFTTDDHGPSVPAQDFTPGPFVVDTGPRVYEFALQDYWAANEEVVEHLADVTIHDALDHDAAAEADWVHVYDRVTRERRTLKRPEPDAVLTGLRDVAADLRGAARGHGKSEAVRAVVEMRTGEERYVERHMIDASQSGDPAMAAAFPGPLGAPVRGAPVEPPFGCAALPPVGPLTSTEGLRAGDVVRITYEHGWAGIFPVDKVRPAIMGVEAQVTINHPERGYGAFLPKYVAFVGRPDSDGWMAWPGGENPVPGATVEVRTSSKGNYDGVSECMDWGDMGQSGYQIIAFRIIDAAKGKEDAS